ncbi:molybdenum cofactor guanylyltransferase [Spelaeicoccus albus]|uniref:Molybdopterin-guanine dinucleotide biosynthesis protein A n=1 Tax=Spelaeicoccus albus TaxID=1280376 RepID=A0A7Z0D217_9MICO|nr:molybdenum cofactor guanylyltransferase [Spelaeicoccus albus]NYI67424.1 molybdopterin-guanine dinucleotide biosynthesis protein A [Spelaeicoccus albus]
MTRAHILRDVLGVIVLAGGQSSRMRGQDKMTARFGSDTVLNMCLTNVAGQFPDSPIIVVGPYRELPAEMPESRVTRVREDPPGGGPVPAIRAGMDAVPSDAALVAVLAGDMPEAPAVLGDLVQPLATYDNLDVAVARAGGAVQPLLAVYRRRTLAGVLAADSSLRTARSLLTGLRHRFVEVPERLCYDIDTPEDLSAARSRIGPTRRRRR